MKNTQNVTIGLLAVTAIVLGALVIGMYTPPQAAYADSAVKQGDYIMVTAAISSDVDLLHVIDVISKRMNVYQVNINTRAIELVCVEDMQRAFNP
jgi:hypothetical protein